MHFTRPARGDVVVLEPPDAEARSAAGSDLVAAVLLKRVVAVEGDVVEVRDGHVRIDGAPASEGMLSLDAGGGPDLGPIRVPQGKLLLLGDNRGNSRDGRVFGFVDREQVLGRALAIVARDGHATFEKL
jgi:signal peptidase I